MQHTINKVYDVKKVNRNALVCNVCACVYVDICLFNDVLGAIVS